MRHDIPLGHIRGIRVGLSWSVLLIAGFYVYVLATVQFPNQAPWLSAGSYWIAGSIGALGFFASLFAHEMSHALMAQHHDISVRGITLWLLGGFAELDAEPATPGQQFSIAAVGPVSNLALGAVLWGIHSLLTGDTDLFAFQFGTSGLVAVTIGWLAFVNLLLGAFNLLPAAPLDGGQLFGAGVWAATGDRMVARRWAAYAGVTLGAAAVVYGLASMRDSGSLNGLWLMIIGWWVAAVAIGEVRRSRMEVRLHEATAADIMRPDPPILPAGATIDGVFAHGAPQPFPPAFCAQAPDGRIVGLLTTAQIHSIDPASRAALPIGQLAFPIHRVTCVATDTSALDLIEHLRGDGVGQVLVVHHDGRVAGTIGVAEVNRAARGVARPVPSRG